MHHLLHLFILLTLQLPHHTTSKTPPPSIYETLAGTLSQRRLAPHAPATVTPALHSLATAQSALKSLDGAAHEAYQLTHKNTLTDSSSSSSSSTTATTTGRASRSAGRIGCAADAFWACELCEDRGEELVVSATTTTDEGIYRREVCANVTLESSDDDSSSVLPLRVVVLYEAEYRGGGGSKHGGIDGLSPRPSSSPSSSADEKKGRVIVVIHDGYADDLNRTLNYLDVPPKVVSIKSGLVAKEVASVHEGLWRLGARVLEEVLLPALERVDGNGTVAAVHFVGRSLGGGAAALAAAVFDGTLPAPPPRKGRRSGTMTKKKKKKKKTRGEDVSSSVLEVTNDGNSSVPVSGRGMGRSSAVTLGSPPCLSSNVKATFITSLIHGDDIIPRTSRDTLDRLTQRLEKTLKANLLTKRIGWVGDAVSLTVNNLKSHAHGSDGEEGRLSVPGRAYLIRPRRFGGGSSSMHEVGGVTGREAMRARVLWQLGDVLLSESLWNHHKLEAYIKGLERLHLRHFEEEEEEETRQAA
mmetsp:Transcript_42284/g.51499  ORF Transcript_42284/g.51499 Transcript_42284/m.51499 type:complete len:526 (-) Transcript_42284:38-1615(-)